MQDPAARILFRIRTVLSPIWVKPCAKFGSISESRSSSITCAFICAPKSRRLRSPVTTVPLVESAIQWSTVRPLPDGIIVYIKPACYGNEPRDIYEYLKRSKTFPHESTADQFYSESQFESYRMLGAHTKERLCTDCGGDFRCVIRDIVERHLKMEPPDWLAGLLDAK